MGSIAWALAAPAMAEREAFRTVKENFRETWCATYGVDPTDQGLDLWEAFADRNRTSMGENWQNIAYVDPNLDGSRTHELYIDIAIENSPLGICSHEQFGSNSDLSNFFWVFEFERGYGSPPSC